MKMRIRRNGWIVGAAGLCLLTMTACSQQNTPAPSPAKATTPQPSNPVLTPTGPSIRLTQRSGSKMRLEGTSTAHDWRSESGLILGYLEVGPNFPLTPGQKVAPGKVEAKGEARVKVTSLKSKNKDGSYYDDKMDDKMYNMMSYTNHPDIVFKITDLNLTQAAADANSPYLFDAKGDLEVAGVTNNISFPVKVMPQPEKDGENRVKISGEVPLKMSQYGMQPATMIVVVKTGDDVKVVFDWVVGAKKPGGEKK
jgi:polyisoprenoid-binding protein YceI